ncbi:MAG: carbamoyltransferase C-terminal domain-containing protein [Polyangiaceae bacterium]
MRVLGINGYHEPVTSYFSEWGTKWFHDAAAVLVEDGVVLAAVEEERLTRKKHTGSFPARAIDFCLSARGISLDDVDHIAVGEEGGHGAYRDAELSAEKIAHTLRVVGLTKTDLTAKIRLVEHHVAHAMSAFLPACMDASLVVTLDGFGDGIAGSVSLGQGGKLETLRRIEVEQSLGNFYGAVLPYLGYSAFDEYKVMGLASYGDPTRARHLVSQIYELLPEGAYRFRIASTNELIRLLGPFGPPRFEGTPFLQHHMDLAAGFQEAFERIVIHLLTHFRETTGVRSLCFAGGCAQNSVFNGRLAASGLFDAIYVHPASNDAGTALGAALSVAQVASGRDTRASSAVGAPPLATMYLGPAVEPDRELLATFAAFGAFVDVRTPGDEGALCEEVADLLADGHVVGWVQGRAEFGPRALGNRSILADPRKKSSQERINAVVKEREAYRPFAPAVIEEAASLYFELTGRERSASCMTFTVPVREAKRAHLPAITHVDGTGRVQTVSQAHNPRFWALLRAFERKTGVPILLNTSFNSSREPIVTTAHDALTCLLTSQMEYLVVGGHIMKKRDFDEVALLDLRVEVPSHVLLSVGRDPKGNEQAWLVTRGTGARMSVSMDLARHLLRDQTELPAEKRRALAGELAVLWRERLVALVPPPKEQGASNG